MPKREYGECQYRLRGYRDRETELWVWDLCEQPVGKGKVRHCDLHVKMSREDGERAIRECEESVVIALGREKPRVVISTTRIARAIRGIRGDRG